MSNLSEWHCEKRAQFSVAKSQIPHIPIGKKEDKRWIIKHKCQPTKWIWRILKPISLIYRMNEKFFYRRIIEWKLFCSLFMLFIIITKTYKLFDKFRFLNRLRIFFSHFNNLGMNKSLLLKIESIEKWKNLHLLYYTSMYDCIQVTRRTKLNPGLIMVFNL